MNGIRRAELKEAEGLLGFMALNYLSFFTGFLSIPGSGMRIYRLHWEHLLGALLVPTLGRSLQCLGKPYQPEVKQGFHRQRKINTHIPHHLLYLQRGAALSPCSNKETQH